MNLFIQQFKQSRSFQLGVIIVGILIFIAIFGGLFAPYNMHQLTDSLRVPPLTENHFLGTDALGRDILSEIIYGTRTSLIIGFVAALISAVIGVFIGAIAGYFGGRVDQVLTEFMNIFVMTPSFFLILIIIAFFGSSIINVMIIIGLTGWTGNARLMRGQAKSLRERTFIKASEVIGFNKFSVLNRHIIPNAMYPIIANTIMNISGAILTEAGLSFLGLGDPNVVSWGQIISHGRAHLTNAWWISTFPGIMIVITVLGLFLIGDGINNMMSPKMQKRAVATSVKG